MSPLAAWRVLPLFWLCPLLRRFRRLQQAMLTLPVREVGCILEGYNILVFWQ